MDFDDFFLDISEVIANGEDNCITNSHLTMEAPSNEANETMEFKWGAPDGISRADGWVTQIFGLYVNTTMLV